MHPRLPVGPKASHVEFPVVRVSGRYRVGKLLGSGTFGKCSVYSGKDVRKGKEVALKVERYEGSHSDLCHEYEVYKDITGCAGISRVYWYGKEGPCNVMVMDRYQLSLEDMVRDGALDLHTVVSFASQMLHTLESLHFRGYIHRDIKPDNFMVGVDNRIYLIDFGLAQLFRNPDTLVHIPLTTGHRLVGTIRYTSINSHLGLQQSRRDDLESLAYTLVYILYGKLPWQGIRLTPNRSHLCTVFDEKQAMSNQSCDIIPSHLATFLDHTRSLRFAENPNYIYLHALLQSLPPEEE